MMPPAFVAQVLTMIVAASYVTLGIADPNAAEHLWLVYALVTLVLAVLNLSYYARRRR